MGSSPRLPFVTFGRLRVAWVGENAHNHITICSGLGGARTLLSGSSGRRYTVSATSPSICHMLECGTKKPGATFGVTPGCQRVIRLCGRVSRPTWIKMVRFRVLRHDTRLISNESLIARPDGRHDSASGLVCVGNRVCSTTLFVVCHKYRRSRHALVRQEFAVQRELSRSMPQRYEHLES